MSTAGELGTERLLVHPSVVFERPGEDLEVIRLLSHVAQVLGREGRVCRGEKRSAKVVLQAGSNEGRSSRSERDTPFQSMPAEWQQGKGARERGVGVETEESVTHDLPPTRRQCPWTPGRILHLAVPTFLLLVVPAIRRRVSRRRRKEGSTLGGVATYHADEAGAGGRKG